MTSNAIPSGLPIPSGRQAAPVTPPNSPSWDVSLQQLSASLSQICSSPGTMSPVTSSRFSLHEYMNKSHGSRESIPEQDSFKANISRPHIVKAVKSGINNNNLNKSFDSSSFGNCAYSSVFVNKDGYRCKKVRVKHEESQKTLHNQLSFICGAKCHCNDAHYVDIGGFQTDQVVLGLTHKETIISGVDVGNWPLEDLMISVGDGGLVVRSVKGDVISSTRETAPEDVICGIFDMGKLDVRAVGKRSNVLSEKGWEERFYPVLCDNQQNRTWKVVLHVGDLFERNHLHLRTYDDMLFLEFDWSRQRTNSNKYVIIKIPPHVKARTVNALVNEKDQLLIEGIAMCGRERSYTM